MSLTKRLAIAGVGGFGALVLAMSLGVGWAADTIARNNTNAFLATYADVLVPAITIDTGVASVDTSNPVIAAIPRYWQINHGATSRQRSQRLDRWLPLMPPSPDGVRFRIADDNAPDIEALQRQYLFPGGDIVTVTFGLEAAIADAYAEEQRSALRDRLQPLFAGVALLAVILLASQVLIVVVPLHKLRRDFGKLEDGSTNRLATRYPAELRSLTQAMNVQLDRNAAVVDRYRQFASNLSHAIKTPLTMLRLAVSTDDERKNVDAIHSIVERNLARARIVGADHGATAMVDVAPLLQGLARSYRTLSEVDIDVSLPEHLVFKGDAQDFVEAIGNILENACRFARSRVMLVAKAGEVIIRDDGPGLPADERANVMQRGARLDESGSGIGLAIASEIVQLYGGSLQLGDSAGGGLEVTVGLPALRIQAGPGAD